ncbi:MAG TPA: dTDP-4-dehydrorhamnose reductase [Thermoplasmata archaeon]|nr:dTDP-4-dehydrorhamnose reductase [Thermoplasmata archaeon]
MQDLKKETEPPYFLREKYSSPYTRKRISQRFHRRCKICRRHYVTRSHKSVFCSLKCRNIWLQLKQKRVLIIGSSGLVGSELVKTLSEFYSLYPMTHKDLEVTSRTEVERVLKETKPHFVINLSVCHTLEAEKDPFKAFLVNSIAVKDLSDFSRKFSFTLVHFSTDYVFSGKKGKPYFEDDTPGPVNVYGASKLAGELFLQHLAPSHYLVRTSSLFGSGRQNFVTSMIEKVKRNERIEVVKDIRMAPTYSKDLAFQVQALMIFKKPFGLYHITNSGECSWFEFAQEIFKILDLSPKLFPISIKDRKEPLKRPLYSVLASKKIRLRSWREALEEFLTFEIGGANDKGFERNPSSSKRR